MQYIKLKTENTTSYAKNQFVKIIPSYCMSFEAEFLEEFNERNWSAMPSFYQMLWSKKSKNRKYNFLCKDCSLLKFQFLRIIPSCCISSDEELSEEFSETNWSLISSFYHMLWPTKQKQNATVLCNWKYMCIFKVAKMLSVLLHNTYNVILPVT